MQVLDVGPPEQNIADKVHASSAANSENKGPPHSNIDLQANAAAAQLELSVQMICLHLHQLLQSHFRETVSALLDSLQSTIAVI